MHIAALSPSSSFAFFDLIWQRLKLCKIRTFWFHRCNIFYQSIIHSYLLSNLILIILILPRSLLDIHAGASSSPPSPSSSSSSQSSFSISIQYSCWCICHIRPSMRLTSSPPIDPTHILIHSIQIQIQMQIQIQIQISTQTQIQILILLQTLILK